MTQTMFDDGSPPESRRSAPGWHSPPERPNTSAGSASTGSSSTPSTTRRYSHPGPHVCGHGRHVTAPMVRIPWNDRKTSSACSTPAPGASLCRWSTREEAERPSRRRATTRRAAAASAAVVPRSLRHDRVEYYRTPTTTCWSSSRSSTSRRRKRRRHSQRARRRCLLHRPERSGRIHGPRTRRAARKRRAAPRRRYRRDSRLGRNGVAPGIHCSGAAGINQRIAEGFQFCAMASELRYMLSGLRDDLNKLNWEAAHSHLIEDAGHGEIVRY